MTLTSDDRPARTLRRVQHVVAQRAILIPVLLRLEERMAAKGYHGKGGKRRDDDTLDFLCGAWSAMEHSGNAQTRDAGQWLGTVLTLVIAVRPAFEEARRWRATLEVEQDKDTATLAFAADNRLDYDLTLEEQARAMA